jgi:uridine kinase
VTIVRSGVAMERPLLKAFQDAPIGKLLIQTDPSVGEPQLHYCKLPSDIHRRFVFLNDAQCSTGAAAVMAIRVLLDHDVPQDHIIFCCFLTSKHAAHLIHSAFPKVRMVTCQVDRLDESNHLTAGFGCYGDRYFGTEV